MAKVSEKELLRLFEEKCNRVIDSTTTGVAAYETEQERADRIQALLRDYERFCSYYFPTYCTAKMADFHRKEVRYVVKNPNTVNLWQWFREGAKSVHANFMLPMFLYFNADLNGMIAGSANQDLSIRLLIDIKANFESNQRLINDFGDHRSYGNWEMQSFVTNKGVGFYGFGVEQSPRGTRFGHKRPNYGTVDDLNDKKTLKNDRISREQYEWVKEDLMPALWIKKWRLVVPQNKFHKNCVTSLFENDPEIKTRISRVNLLDEAGESNWKSHITTEEANAKIRAMGYFSAQREYFNNPVQEGTLFKRDYIVYTKRLPFRSYDALVAYTDPSYKNTHKSDYKATILVGKKGLEYTVLKAFVDKVSTVDMFSWHYQLDELAEDNGLIRHYMEANFIQDLHKDTLPELARQKGRQLRISMDLRAKPDKFQRISNLEPLFTNGKLKFNQAEKENPNMMRLIDQLLAFEKGSGINDDGPDALEGAIYKLEEMTMLSQQPSFVSRPKSKFAY